MGSELISLCYRINIIPNSVNTAAVQIQVFPRSLKKLKSLCTHNNVSLSSTKIPGILIHPGNAQALAIKLGPRDSSNGINVWPMLVFNGEKCHKKSYRLLRTFLSAPDEFSAFPSVKKMDEEISSLLRTAVVLKNAKHAEVRTEN